MNLTVLLIEDDRELRATLCEALLVEGYRVRACASLADTTAVLTNSPTFDLVLLDLGLPDGDGEYLLYEIRRSTTTPLIVISARPEEDRKVQLLDAGADDYLVKPFSLSELLARMRVALRHRGLLVKPTNVRYTFGNLLVDLEVRRVLRNGIEVHLTPTEYELLARLVRQAGRVVTHRQLLADIWGTEYIEHTHYLRLFMAQLRAKLEADPTEPKLLLTEPGVGYRLADSVS
jgi:two-component system, OmpR family, KDP operon response regulator KdpE